MYLQPTGELYHVWGNGTEGYRVRLGRMYSDWQHNLVLMLIGIFYFTCIPIGESVGYGSIMLWRSSTEVDMAAAYRQTLTSRFLPQPSMDGFFPQRDHARLPDGGLDPGH